MFYSGLLTNMYDLAASVAVCVYNRTPHSANDMQPTLQKFNPNFNLHVEQIKTFCSLAYSKIQ